MKYARFFAAAAVLVAVASSANAATIENAYTIIVQENGSSGHSFFGTDKKGNSFLDIYDFTFSTKSDLGMALLSIANKNQYTLDFTSFDLYSGSTLVVKGTSVAGGALDVWSLSGQRIQSGIYSLQVSGHILGSSGGSYGGNASVSPVPEPATWIMLGFGIAAVGFMARRRKSAAARSLSAAA